MIETALVALADLLDGLKNDATPAVALKGVFLYPDEYADLVEALQDEGPPVAFLAEVVNVTNRVARSAAVGRLDVYWRLEIVILLARGEITSDEQAKEIGPLYREWVIPVLDALAADQTIGGSVTLVGVSNQQEEFAQFAEWTAGAIGMGELGTYWGVRFEVPVLQRIIPDKWS